MPLISIITSCRNEADYLGAFLRSLDEQIRESFDIEAILADGHSTDGTRKLLDEFAADRPWVRVIANPQRIASTGLNLAIEASRGSIIIRMDGHTVYASDYVACCVALLEKEQAASVGGPVRIAPGTYWQDAIGLACSSRFFSGGSRVYDVNYRGRVDSVPYGCWPRQVFEAVGLYDERMVRNQDDELALRIGESGGEIWQSGEIRSWYHPRRSLRGLAKQFFGYGFWKVYTMRKHRTVVRFRHLAPATALSSFFLLLVRSVVGRSRKSAPVTAVVGYAATILTVSLGLLKGRRDALLLPALLLVFGVAHVAYGAGMLAGFLRFQNRAAAPPAPQIVL